jgi:peptidyl-tRNA hydrolase
MERYRPGNAELFRMWERQGQPKIALKVKDISEMVGGWTHSQQAAAVTTQLATSKVLVAPVACRAMRLDV